MATAPARVAGARSVGASAGARQHAPHRTSRLRAPVASPRRRSIFRDNTYRLFYKTGWRRSPHDLHSSHAQIFRNISFHL